MHSLPAVQTKHWKDQTTGYVWNGEQADGEVHEHKSRLDRS